MKADFIVNELDGTVNMNISYREGEIGKNLTPQEAETSLICLPKFVPRLVWQRLKVGC